METLARNRLILLAPTPQNGQTHSLFELFDNSVGLALQTLSSELEIRLSKFFVNVRTFTWYKFQFLCSCKTIQS